MTRTTRITRTKMKKNKDDIAMVQGGGGSRPSSPGRGRVRRVHGGAAICGQSKFSFSKFFSKNAFHTL